LYISFLFIEILGLKAASHPNTIPPKRPKTDQWHIVSMLNHSPANQQQHPLHLKLEVHNPRKLISKQTSSTHKTSINITLTHEFIHRLIGNTSSVLDSHCLGDFFVVHLF
jgi:hypothetical protein